jgi:hypothetical protein
LHYYGQMASALWDRDLDLSNDIAESPGPLEFRLGIVYGVLYQREQPNNPFAIGLAVLSAPYVEIARYITGEQAFADRYDHRVRAAFSATTWLLVLAGLIALQRTLRRWLGEWYSLLSTMLLFLGSGLPFYTWHEPAMSHGASFGFSAMVLWSGVRYHERPDWIRAGTCGILIGLAMLVRWQTMLMGFIPLAAVLSTRPRGWYFHLLLMGAVALAMFLPQMLYWRQVHGAFVTAPQGRAFFVWEVTRLWYVLFSAMNGLFHAHPLLLLLACCGAWGWRGLPRWLGLSCAAVLLASWAVNSLPGDWWAGGSFGGRRFSDVLPALVLVGSVGFLQLPRTAQWLIGLAGVLFVTLNLLVLIRAGQQWFFPFLWVDFLDDVPRLIRWILDYPRILFTSDLAVEPTGGLGSAVYMRSFFAASAAAVVPCLVMVLAGCCHERIHRSIMAVPLAVTLFAWGWWVSFLSTAEWTNLDRHLAWRRVVRETQQVEQDPTPLWIVKREFERQHGYLPDAQLQLLDFYLSRNLYAEALHETADALHHFPHTVAGLWARHATRSQEGRTRIVDEYLSRYSPGQQFLEELYFSSLHQGETRLMEEADSRIGGTRARREWRHYMAELYRLAPQDDLDRRLRRASRIDPLNPVWQFERIRHSPSATGRLHAMAELTSLTAIHSNLGSYVAATQPGHETSFQERWHSTLTFEMQAAEAAGSELAFENRWREITRLHLPQHLADHYHARGARLRRLNQSLRTRSATSGDDSASIRLLAIDLWPEDGWGVAEPPGDLKPYRWSVSPIAYARLPQPLEPGDYTIKINGFCWPDLSLQRTMRLAVLGTDVRNEALVPPGSFVLAFGVRIERPLDRPVLALSLPVLPVRDYEQVTADNRWLGFLFTDLIITPTRDETWPTID